MKISTCGVSRDVKILSQKRSLLIFEISGYETSDYIIIKQGHNEFKK